MLQNLDREGVERWFFVSEIILVCCRCLGLSQFMPHRCTLVRKKAKGMLLLGPGKWKLNTEEMGRSNPKSWVGALDVLEFFNLKLYAHTCMHRGVKLSHLWQLLLCVYKLPFQKKFYSVKQKKILVSLRHLQLSIFLHHSTVHRDPNFF